MALAKRIENWKRGRAAPGIRDDTNRGKSTDQEPERGADRTWGCDYYTDS